MGNAEVVDSEYRVFKMKSSKAMHVKIEEPRERKLNALKNNVKQVNLDSCKGSFADVKHKKCTGANNWEKFMVSEGLPVKRERPERNKRNKLNNMHSANDKSAKSHNEAKPKITKVVGMDCEMVGIGEKGRDSILARVSLVNSRGECIYDKFVQPRETVTDYRTYVSGVREHDLKNAENFQTVQKEVADIIKHRILVGHGLKNDLEVLFLSHPKKDIRDTSKFYRKKGKGTPSLKNLASEYLNVKIQDGEHSSVQDARAAVLLYGLNRKKWEAGGGDRKNVRIDTHTDLTIYSNSAVEDT